MAVLQILKGNRPGQILELRGERTILGRHPSCEIVLDNAAVSRQHAQIVHRQGCFFLEDLRSRNRTYLNGIAIEGRTPLNDADEVKICDIVMQFFHERDSATGLTDGDKVETPQTPPKAGRGSRNPTRTMLQSIPVETAPEEHSGPSSSSIISTLDAKTSVAISLNVKPEVKLRAIVEISNALARNLKLDDVLQSLLDGLFKLFPQADSGFVLLTDKDGNRSDVKSAQKRGGDAPESVRISNTILRKALTSGEAILSADALEDSRFNASDSLEGLSIRSMMCVPLIDKEGQALGVIQLDTQSLRYQFTQADLEVLVSVGSQASLAVENARLHEDVLRRQDIERELRFATQVQLGFLPEKRPSLPAYEFCDYYEPAERVGGDYFDYIALADGRLAIGLADVSGKGIPAALLMARLYSSVRLHLFSQPTAGKVLGALNAEIHAQGMEHRFVTFVLLILDPSTHELTIANAGHLPPIIRSPDGAVRSIGRKESGMPLGIGTNQEFGELKIKIEPGMNITVYTDGITEAMNAAGDLFGRVRLETFVAAHGAAAEALVKGIVAEVDRFCGTRPQRDDMCLVSIRRLAETQVSASADSATSVASPTHPAT